VLEHDRRWAVKMVVNGFGAVCTATVMVVFAATKFRDGAWIVLVLTPILVYIFFAIHHHYRNLARNLTLEHYDAAPPRIRRHRVILPVSGVHRGTLEALNYARSLSNDVTAVHVSTDPIDAEKVLAKWDLWGDGVRLVVIDSPYRLLIEPLLSYVEKIAANRQQGEMLTVVVPQFVPERRLANLLHMQTAFFLRVALLGKRGIVIIEVPYQIRAKVDTLE